MRATLLVAALVLPLTACGGGGGGGGGGMCEVDQDCGGGQVCARNGECDDPADVRAVKVTWTVGGQPASTQTCANHPSLYLQFDGPDFGDDFAFEPVPCDQGQFNIDKLAKRFTQVELGPDGGPLMYADIDPTTGSVSFDLVP